MAFKINLGMLGVELTLDSKKFKEGIANAAKKVDAFGDRMRKRVAGASKAATKQLGRFGAAVGGTVAVGLGIAANAAREFEAAIASAGAKSGATQEQMQQLEQAAIQAGLKSAFSAKEAADALGFLAMAGLDVAEQTGALPGTLQLAAAGNLELAEAADLATNVMSGFGFEVGELGRVNDVLAKAANSANTSVQELGHGLSFAAPVAAGLGISMEEVTATIGKLSDAGIKSGRAGRGLNAMLKNLGKAADTLGVSFDNADLKTKGLTGVLKELEAAGLTAANATQLFGGIAGPGVSALLNQGIESIEELETKLQDAGGAAAEVAERQLNTFDGALKLLRGSVETLGIVFGKALTPILKELALVLIDDVNALMTNEDAFESFADAVATGAEEIATAMESLAPAITVVTTASGALIDGFKLLKITANLVAIGLGGMYEMFLRSKVALNNTSENVQELNDYLKRYNGVIAETRAEIDSFGTSTMNGAKAGEALTKVTRNAAGALRDGAKATRELKLAQAEQEKAAEEVIAPMDGLTELLNGYTDVIPDAEDGTRRFNDKLDETKKKAEDASRSLTELLETYDKAGEGDYGYAFGGGAVTNDFADQLHEDRMKAIDDASKAELERISTGMQAAVDNASKITEEGAKQTADALKLSKEAIDAERQARAEHEAMMWGAAQTLAGESEAAGMAISAMSGDVAGVTSAFAAMWAETEGVKQIMAQFQEVWDATFGTFMSEVAGSAAYVLQPVFDLLKALAPVLKVMLYVMNPIAIALKGLAKVVGLVTKPIQRFVDSVKKAILSIRVAIINIGRKRENRVEALDNGEIYDPLGKKGRQWITVVNDDGTTMKIDYKDWVNSVSAAAKAADHRAKADENAVTGTNRLHDAFLKTTEAMETHLGAVGFATDSMQNLGDYGMRVGTAGGRAWVEEDNPLKDAMNAWRESLWGATEATRANADANRQAAEQILNAPEVFDHALSRYQAWRDGGGGAVMPTGAPAPGGGMMGGITIQTLVVRADDPSWLEQQLQGLAQRRGGSPFAGPVSPYSISSAGRGF